jgi:hypothetical protein
MENKRHHCERNDDEIAVVPHIEDEEDAEYNAIDVEDENNEAYKENEDDKLSKTQ